MSSILKHFGEDPSEMVASHASIALPRAALHCSVSSSCSRSLRFASGSSSALRSRGFVKVRAGPEADRSPAQTKSSAVQKPAAPRRPGSSAPGPDTSLQTVFVEDEEVSVEGVAKVDRKESSGPATGRIALLAGGDILALLVFAAIGRMSHGMSVLDWESFRTADPFIAGWLLGAYLVGGYGPAGQGVDGLSSAVFAAVKSWAVGIPVGLVIRGVTTGHVPAPPFVVVSMASTLVLLVGWRAAITAVFPNDKQSNKKRDGDRKGGAFELIQLLTSLVKRW